MLFDIQKKKKAGRKEGRRGRLGFTSKFRNINKHTQLVPSPPINGIAFDLQNEGEDRWKRTCSSPACGVW